MKAFPPFRLDTVNQCLWRGDGPAEERLLLIEGFETADLVAARVLLDSSR
jgi:hypothetical protein